MPGRPIGPVELERVRGLLAAHLDWSRYRLSRDLGLAWSWRSLAGQSKDMLGKSGLLKQADVEAAGDFGIEELVLLFSVRIQMSIDRLLQQVEVVRRQVVAIVCLLQNGNPLLRRADDEVLAPEAHLLGGRLFRVRGVDQVVQGPLLAVGLDDAVP